MTLTVNDVRKQGGNAEIICSKNVSDNVMALRREVMRKWRQQRGERGMTKFWPVDGRLRDLLSKNADNRRW